MMTPFYETDRAVSEYLLFHFGEPDQLLPWSFGPKGGLNYPARCVSELLNLSKLSTAASALDLGCAVGRSTFELARHCDKVIGIDYSEQFIITATELKATGSRDYTYVLEGDLCDDATAFVPDEIERERVAFEQGDAMNLRDDLGQFDVVLMANLLCRLSDPQSCLSRMAGLVKPGGQLLITTPCTWLEEYTPRENWLGGFNRDGAPVRTIDRLREILNPHFELVTLKELPFLIREHARKFQWTVAEGSAWIRNADSIG